ncbi:MAG: D-glycero-beta-D-manno-heptose 1-phosphate adenylyltransferase [candidate division WOR-3 bacterium]
MKGLHKDPKTLGKCLRDAGYKIVFTNGCFDILHRGHLELLKFAKSLGDVLVVGLNDDDSIKRLKGEGRPINKLEDRAFALLATKWVDFVIPFSEDTPERLIMELEPDVLVKGGDYDIKSVVGADFVISRGGRVEIFKYIEGYSTTEIIKRIKGWVG